MAKLSGCLAIWACAAVALGADMPRPDLKNPVNYVAWVNAEFGKNITDNAAEKYLAAVAAYVADDDAREIYSERRWTDEERESVKKWVARNEECLARLGQATVVRDCFFQLDPNAPSLYDVQHFEAATLRYAGQALAARARLELTDGRVDAAIEDLGCLLRVAQHLEMQPDLVQYLRGLALRDAAYTLLADAPEIAPAQASLEAILKAARKSDRPLRPPFRQLQCEAAMCFTCIQLFSRDEDGDGLVERLELGESHLALEKPLSVDELAAACDDALTRWRKVLAAPGAKAYEESKQLHGTLQTQYGALVGPLVTNYATVVRHILIAESKRSAARLVLRIHAYHAANGDWPADLATAAKGEPASTLIDPFSGSEFKYRLEGGQPLLYSVGSNQTDDGGRPGERSAFGDDGDYVYWPPVDWRNFAYRGEGYRVAAPPPWRRTEPNASYTVPGELKCVWEGSNSASITVFEQPFVVPLEPEELANQSAEALKQAGFEVRSQGVTQVAGRDAMSLVVAGKGTGGALAPGGTIPTCQHWVAVPVTGRLVVILLTAPETDYQGLERSFAKLLATVEISPE